MNDTIVLDASIAAKCFFEEPGQAEALQLVASRLVLLAPDLIFAELASIASKKVRRGLTSDTEARAAVRQLNSLITHIFPIADLAEPAFDLAVRHGFSAYDSFYLALAERQGVMLATADRKLVTRAAACGLGDLILADSAL